MEYYLSAGNEKRGPYSVAELAARGIGAESLVMPTDGGVWTPAWQVEELRPIISHPSGGTTTPPPDLIAPEETAANAPIEGQPILEEPRIVQGYATEQPELPPHHASPSRRKRGCGCLTALLAAIAALLLLLVATCPKPQQHKEAVAEVVAEVINEEASLVPTDTDDPFSRTIKDFTATFTAKMVAIGVDNLVSVDNYFVCSVGRLHYANQSHVVSVGLLGHVFTIGKAELSEAAHRYADEAKKRMEEQTGLPADHSSITTAIDSIFSAPAEKIMDKAMEHILDKAEREINDALNEAGIPTNSF